MLAAALQNGTVPTACEKGRLGGQLTLVCTALLGTALAQVAAEDLACSISRVRFCSSDNSIMKGHNLFLPRMLCSSILPPSFLFPETLTLG